MGRYAEAGAALDAYLRLTAPDADYYRARGLIHHRFREYPQAIQAYTWGLLQRRDAELLAYRGWAYLKSQAFTLALSDFEEVLKEDPRQTDALCGRALVHVLMGKLDKALNDAEQVLRHGKQTPTLLCSLAIV